MKSYLLGIDVGTQSIKICFFDEKGAIAARVAIPHYMQNIRPGWATEKPELWWSLIKEGIREALAQGNISPKQVAGIGVGAVMHCPVALDRDGNLLEPDVQMYCDKRTADLVQRIRSMPETEDLVLKHTSNLPAAQWMGLKIKWIQENTPEIYEKTYKYISAKDYINYRLCGEFATDPSEASGTCLMRADSDEWSYDVLSLFGIDKEKLPNIRNAAEVIGRVHKTAAGETGLSEGTPVVCGGGDMLCGLLGAGLVEKGIVIDLTGTGSVVAYYDEQPCFDPRIDNLRHVLTGWTPFNCLDSSGGALRWFLDTCCKKESELAEEQKKRVFVYLEEEALKTPPGAGSMLFFPYLQGERMGSPYSKGVFLGMTPATTTAHMSRAVMEGVAFEHNRAIEVFKQGHTKITKIIHTGGAAKSPVWSQIKADIYEMPVEVSRMEEETAWGAAILAAAGVGLGDGPGQMAKTPARSSRLVYEPDLQNSQRYRAMFELYKDIHNQLQKPFERLAKIL